MRMALFVSEELGVIESLVQSSERIILIKNEVILRKSTLNKKANKNHAILLSRLDRDYIFKAYNFELVMCLVFD